MGASQAMRRPLRCPRCRVRVFAVALLLAVRAGAGEITELALDPAGDGFRLHAKALVEAPLDGVWRVLTDYAGLHRVSARIVESELVAVSPEGIARVRTLNRLCFLVFCRDIRHVQLIRELGYGDFESDSVPEESDLSDGHARWRLFADGGRTRLDIDFRFVMSTYSWVPAWVNRVVARSVLEADAAELIQGIEQAARRREGRSDGR